MTYIESIVLKLSRAEKEFIRQEVKKGAVKRISIRTAEDVWRKP